MATSNPHDRLLVAAIKKRDALLRKACFSVDHPEMQPTDAQKAVLENTTTLFHYIIAGNQCHAEGTLITTPTGAKPIETVLPGDQVYNEFGELIKVQEVYRNGQKEVITLTNRKVKWAETTANHKFLTDKGIIQVDQMVPGHNPVKRIELSPTMGAVNEPHAYAIGVLAGDGCCRQPGRGITLSSETQEIPDKVAQCLGINLKARRNHVSNYNWMIKNAKCDWYNEWLKGKYAHEKELDIAIIRTWNKESLLQLVAGLIDTDGSVYIDSWNTLCIQFGMQAKAIVSIFQWIVLSLWQTPTTLHEDCRDKYKNGSVWYVRIANNDYSKRILQELGNRICTKKRWKPEYSQLQAKRSNHEWIGLVQAEKRIASTYNILVDSPTHLYCLANGLVSSNSGKSQLGGRIVSWWFEDAHPHMTRPVEWGEGPLMILVCGRLEKQIEHELWAKKIKPYITPGTYKEIRAGQALQYVESLTNGNKIIFFSHHNATEAREKLQSFTAHVVWVDEQVKDAALITEIHQRLLAYRGRLYCTFTPLVRNEALKKLIESVKPPLSRLHRFKMLDNPIFKGREEEILERFQGYSDAEKSARLEGDWYYGDKSVFTFDGSRHIELPPDYSPSWRHVESVDPASSGNFGFLLLAECPTNHKWYVIQSEYIPGAAATDLLDQVEKLTMNINLVKQVCDSASTWYTKEASNRKRYYLLADKHGRKMELIANLNQALHDGWLMVAPWCEKIQEEFSTCQWHPNIQDKIINEKSYHLLDSLRYFLDIVPAPERPVVRKTYDEWLVEMDHKRRLMEAKLTKTRCNTTRTQLKRSRRWA